MADFYYNRLSFWERVKLWIYSKCSIYVVSYYDTKLKTTRIDSLWWSERKAKKREDELYNDPTKWGVTWFKTHINKIIQY